MKNGIDLGHGLNSDRGADGYISEETIINEVGTLVIEKLNGLGEEIEQLRPTSASSINNSLFQRYDKSDNTKCDRLISIHANASNGEGHGTEVYTFGAKEIPEARAVLNNIAALGFRNRGIKDGSNLAVIKHSQAKAMLIEICFCDNKADTDLYTSLGAEKIANAIVKGLTGKNIPVAKGQWKRGESVGNEYKWWYEHSDGTYTTNNWEEIDGEWYFFDKYGWMCTGWIVSPYSKKYFLLWSNGQMARNCEAYGYKFLEDGTAVKIK